MQIWAVLFVLTNASTDTMFRTLPATIIRNIKTVVTATGVCHVSGYPVYLIQLYISNKSKYLL